MACRFMASLEILYEIFCVVGSRKMRTRAQVCANGHWFVMGQVCIDVHKVRIGDILLALIAPSMWIYCKSDSESAIGPVRSDTGSIWHVHGYVCSAEHMTGL